MENRKFVIECEISERWVNDFCAMLKQMQYFGEQGHSGVVGIYSDGDGDFRPSFNIHTEYDKTKASLREVLRQVSIFDAG
jgi:hypothetical protein